MSLLPSGWPRGGKEQQSENGNSSRTPTVVSIVPKLAWASRQESKCLVWAGHIRMPVSMAHSLRGYHRGKHRGTEVGK